MTDAWKAIVSTDAVAALWDAGFTIMPRQRHPDPYHLDEKAIPTGRAYQWVHKDDLQWHKDTNWQQVPNERHPGIFAPVGTDGFVAFQSLLLVDKPKAEVDAEHAANHAKAHQNVDDWLGQQAAAGFTGGVTVQTDRSATVVDIGNEAVNQTKIPADMVPHINAILRERDRLVAAFTKEHGDMPTVAHRAKLLEQAIETVRTRVAAETNGESDAQK